MHNLAASEPWGMKFFEVIIMTKAVIFDMYETLVTLYENPPYFGAQIAIDAGIEEEKFQEMWRASETDRTIGKITFEEILEKILKENNCYSETKMDFIVKKRVRNQETAFERPHKDVIPTLRALKKKGVRLGLVSNCFSEEAAVIKKSVLFPYFDAACLSFDEGMQKPDPAIFERCLERLKVPARDCLYVGDGGSDELEAAKTIGMNVAQAAWYLKENTMQPAKRKAGFRQLETPSDILKII